MSRSSKALYMPCPSSPAWPAAYRRGGVQSDLETSRQCGSTSPGSPKDLNRARAALVAAGLQGLVFGLVPAAVDRAGARGYKAVTNQSPV